VRKVYRGRDLEVSFDLDICVHIGECLRGQPEVFKLNRRPWILSDLADADEVAEIVRLCPSGALQYKRLDGGPEEDPDGATKVTPTRDGPRRTVKMLSALPGEKCRHHARNHAAERNCAPTWRSSRS